MTRFVLFEGHIGAIRRRTSRTRSTAAINRRTERFMTNAPTSHRIPNPSFRLTES